MGCCTSTSAALENSVKLEEGSNRRRLSIGVVQAAADFTTPVESQEEDRGLIAGLTAEDLLSLSAAAAPGDSTSKGKSRRFSIASETDSCKTSFANKTIKQLGDEMDPQRGLGFTCRKGLKPESPNQDSWMILSVDSDFSIYGVFDGHGQKGHDVSNFVKENLPKLVLRDARFKNDNLSALLRDSFLKIQGLINTMDRTKKLSAQMSGTTATIAIHNHAQGKLSIAHVADSTAVLGRYEDSSRKKMQAITLTRDHKPNLPDERARIEKAGGRVVFDGYANHRVYAKNGKYPGLNMSRCLGDLLGHQDAGCTAEPEVSERPIDPLDHVLLLCSDGVWEFITAAEAVQMIAEYPVAKAQAAADRLAKEAWDRWIQEEGGAVVDDITVVLVYLNSS